ncbi:MAG: DUF3822 family protein [Bacteroidales bacterium]|jgi:hypothetical protein|nr:DUF3822 family protein [Bacteroidales bacterium]MDD4214971.1 DUF3822 family protein [Bacteroidales bacterium]
MESEFNQLTMKTDAGFSTLPTESYQLLLGLNKNSFQILVFDPENNKFIAFAQKQFTPLGGANLYHEKLKNFISENTLLHNTYNNAFLIWETQQATLVPSALYETSEQSAYLRFNQNINEGDKILCDKMKNTGTFNIFSYPDILSNLSLPGKLQVHHHASSLIESMLITSKSDIAQKIVYVNVHPSFFDIVVVEYNKLTFYNTFSYKTAEDFAYFVLFVFNQMKLNPEQQGIYFSGDILRDSQLYDISFKYIRNIDFVKPPVQISNSYILQDIEPHRLYYLYSRILCEL